MHALFGGGLRIDDLVNHVHAIYYLGEDGVAGVTARVQKRIVGHVDKELAGRGVRVGGASHRQGAAHVMQAIAGFVLDRVTSRLLHHLRSETAALHHKARDHTVENGVVVETAVDVFEKIVGTDRCLDRVQFDFDLAEAGIQHDMRGFGGVSSHQVGG